jgi:hypothetical protein
MNDLFSVLNAKHRKADTEVGGPRVALRRLGAQRGGLV